MRHAYVLAVVLLGCSGDRPPPSAAADPRPHPAPDAAVAVRAVDAGVADAASEPATFATAPCEVDTTEDAVAPHDKLSLTRTKYADLPGWADDKLSEAVPSFLRSCEKLAALRDHEPVGHDGHGGVARQWREACAAAAKVPPGDDVAARAMFEAQFVPWIAAGKNGVDGKLTGYNVTELRASRKRHGKFQTPVYARPDDLVMVDLGKLGLSDAHGRRIWGRLDKGELVPFFTRQEIRKGALASRKLELMYVDEPIDLLFAHIEGSAKAKLDDGSVVWLEFAGKNGRSYRGVGGILKAKNALVAPYNGTMQGIRRWFVDHRSQWDEIVDQVHSFIFFSESKLPGAVGSQMVILTPQRSLAIDRAFIAHSTPIWVSTNAPVPGTAKVAAWRKLLIAQDTGGGIRGAVRGDIYWGDDAVAEEMGGRMGGPGRFWILLPPGVTK